MGNYAHAERIIEKFYILSKPFIKSIDFAIKFQFRHLESYIHKDYKNSNHP